MPILQIRDLPADVYERLAAAAERERRSISQEAVVLLAAALRSDPGAKERRKRLLEELAAKPAVSRNAKLAAPESLIREDRER